MTGYKYLLDMERLRAILEAESKGYRVDHAAAILLAQRLTEQCPDIMSTLPRIRERMAYGAVAECF